MWLKSLLFVLTMLSGYCYGQIKLKGEVRHRENSLDQVMIQVYENNAMLRTVAVGRRGQYELDLPLNHQYVLVFRRPYMIPVKLEVDTKVESNWNPEKVVVEIPLNMELFYNYSGMDIQAYRKPIGMVKQSGHEINSFEFVADQALKAELKKVNEESVTREATGEIASEAEEAKDHQKTGRGDAMAADKTTTGSAVDSKPAKPAAPVATHEFSADNAKVTREVERNQDLETAQLAMTEERKKALQIGRQNEATQFTTRHEIVQESKKAKSQVQDSNTESESMFSDARASTMAVRSEQLIALSTTAANREKIQERKPVLRSMKEGWLHEEECLEILQGSAHIVYRKITYNWLVFNTEYFYRGEVEISRTSYEEVRRLFN